MPTAVHPAVPPPAYELTNRGGSPGRTASSPSRPRTPSHKGQVPPPWVDLPSRPRSPCLYSATPRIFDETRLESLSRPSSRPGTPCRAGNRVIRQDSPQEAGVDFVSTLTDDLLVQIGVFVDARSLANVARCSAPLEHGSLKAAETLMRDAYEIDWRRAASLSLPPIRQLHLLERMATLRASSLAIGRGHPLLLVDNGAGYDADKELVTLLPKGCLGAYSPSVASVSFGVRHCLLVDFHGGLWGLGCAKSAGVLGRGDEVVTPAPIHGLHGAIVIAKASCGNGHSVAMARDGDVFTWGRSLDKIDRHTHPDPRRGRAGEAVDVAAGDSHVAVACLTGDAFLWGANGYGQCGVSTADEYFIENPVLATGALAAHVVRRVACGAYHTIFLTAEGSAFSCGASGAGQLGRLTGPGVEAFKPTQILFEEDEGFNSAVRVLQVACGEQHAVCLTDTGRVFAFGDGEHGQLGLGGPKSKRVPTMLRMMARIREVAAGGDATALCDDEGRIYEAGSYGGYKELLPRKVAWRRRDLQPAVSLV